jgi:exosortase/archaeosortase family protein
MLANDDFDRMTSATPLTFALKFVALFALLMCAFEASRGSAFERFVVEKVILVPTTLLIDAVSPGEQVELAGRTLVSPGGASLHVTRGCEGIEMFLLLIAAIAAFPATPTRVAQGLLVGSVLAYILSVARLITLHYVLRYSPALWDALHGLILPLGPIVVLSLYFFRWTTSAHHAT